MKKILTILFLLAAVSATAQVKFEEFFFDRTMRLGGRAKAHQKEG